MLEDGTLENRGLLLLFCTSSGLLLLPQNRPTGDGSKLTILLIVANDGVKILSSLSSGRLDTLRQVVFFYIIRVRFQSQGSNVLSL